MFLLTASLHGAASAAVNPSGVSINWTNCYADLPAHNRNFACATNVGNHRMILSFVVDHEMIDVSGIEFYVQIASTSATLPSWWAFRNAGTCRLTSLGLSTFQAIEENCPDWAVGQASGGIGSYVIGSPDASSAVLSAAAAVPLVALAYLAPGQDYFAAAISVNNAKTVGTGACAGCTTPACILFGKAKVVTNSGVGDVTLTTPAWGPETQWVTWQGGFVHQLQPGSCEGATLYCPFSFGCSIPPSARWPRAGPR